MTQNQINYQRSLEERRHNLAGEAETNRSNVRREELQSESNVETRRSNLAREAETHRSNLARELETNRSNLANEEIGRERNKLQYDASIYSADQGYSGRVDSAYINQYGVSPTDAKKLGKLAISAVNNPVTKVAASVVGNTAKVANRVLAGHAIQAVKAAESASNAFVQLIGGGIRNGKK